MHVAERAPTSADADAEAEQGGADRQAHREHRAEGEDQDDDGGEDAEHLALGQLELGEEVAAVLDLQPVDGVLLVAEVLDLLAEVRDLVEAAVGDVELGEGDRAVLADLLRVLVRAGDRDARAARRRSRRSPSARPATAGRRLAWSALMTIWPRSRPVRVVRLEQVLKTCLVSLSGSLKSVR